MEWDAWNELKGESKAASMENYFNLVSAIDPDFDKVGHYLAGRY